MYKRNVYVPNESLKSITDDEWKFIFDRIPLDNPNDRAILKKTGKLKSKAPIDQCPEWSDHDVDDFRRLDHYKTFFIKLPPEHVVREPNSFEVDEWEDHTKSFHFTVKDLKKLKPGDTLKFLALDRNCFDVPLSKHEAGKCFPAREFFDSEMCTYTHKHGCRGDLVFHFDTGDHTLEDFEFHIECRPNYYYPLTDGKLTPLDDRVDFGKHNHRSWDTFPDDRRVGYRGPMILDCHIDSLPKIYHLPDRHIRVEFPNPHLGEQKRRVRNKRRNEIEDMRSRGLLRSSARVRNKEQQQKNA